MLAILSIIIGIVFILLLFSMLTSAVVEVYHAIRSSRGNHLKDTLEMMLGPEKVQRFLDHTYFKQLSSATKPGNTIKLPVWIDKGTFSTILADILTPEGKRVSVQERIDMIENDELRKVLGFLWRQSGDDPRLFQKKVEQWFDDVMFRAKEWFIDSTKWRLFFFGTVLAAALNADTIQVYKSLSANAALRDEIVNAAEKFANSSDTSRIRATNAPPRDSAAARANFNELKSMYIETVQSPLGLGWGTSKPANSWEWLVKIIGWLLTGVAVTLGAPFWFDLLKKMLALKGGSGGGGGGETAAAPRRVEETAFEIKPSSHDGKVADPGDADH